jgi:hypothetical protein
MLTWEGPDDRGVHRAYDDHALYVIALEDSGGFQVGFFPSPGPECQWASPFATLIEAQASAEECAAHVARIWSRQSGNDLS